MTGAVITGDIVNSTKLSKQEYKTLVKNLMTIFQPFQSEFFRGDSFQVFVKSPADALKVILQSRTMAINLTGRSTPLTDIRASIGIGQVKTPLKTFQLSSGEAFLLSGRNFDQMPRTTKLSIICGEKYAAVNKGLTVLSRFVDYIFERLTLKQAAVVHELLMGHTQTETARRLKKSQATVNKHTQAAGWSEIEKLLLSYQDLTELIQ